MKVVIGFVINITAVMDESKMHLGFIARRESSERSGEAKRLFIDSESSILSDVTFSAITFGNMSRNCFGRLAKRRRLCLRLFVVLLPKTHVWEVALSLHQFQLLVGKRVDKLLGPCKTE